jgi:hypothetical protein
MTDAPSIYAQARADVAGMLGYDLDNLSAEQALRLDVASALRVLLDNQSARLVRGESLDARELLMASEALSRLLPPLRDPPPLANCPDPRSIMWETYLSMRRRGELGERAAEPTLREQLAKLQAENAALRAAAGGSPAITPPTSDIAPPSEIADLNMKPPVYADDPPQRPPVVIEGKAAPPAARTTDRSVVSPAAPRNWDDTEGGQKWRAWVEAGGYAYDRWADNRR